MADKFFNPPSLDWNSPGDLHKRFKFFKQKCQLIFDGPMEKQKEEHKARMLLLWAGDKGLEIYNTSTWDEEEDNLIVDKIFEKFEQYTKPQSNQILSRYQIRCLKQGDIPLEEFITKARSLIDEAGYNVAFKEEMLRDTLIFGITSDTVRKEAISKGNNLTFKQVYDLAKTNESTKSQMQAISQQPVIHNIRSKKKTTENKKAHDPKGTQEPQKYKFKFEGCFRCGNKHSQSEKCPAINARCQYCKKEGHFKKVCMKRRLKQVDQIIKSPGYNGEDILLKDEEEDSSDFEPESEPDSDTEPITVSIGSIASDKTQDLPVDSYPDKLFTTIRLNGKRNLDTGADTCVLTTDDLQALDLSLNLEPCQNQLKGYGGNNIENLGTVELDVKFKDCSLSTRFNVVNAPGHPSMIGCQQAQKLGMVTANINELQTKDAVKKPLTKTEVLNSYQDCFEGIGCFPGERYHITQVDDPSPVIHPARSVPVHILPLYKEELEKMLEDDIIKPVTEPTEWVHSIVCNITENSDGKKKVRLCLDPKDLNENIKREHCYNRSIDEILPELHGKQFFSVADTRKGYWHVELDHESSMLCTFNTPFGRFRFKRLPFGIRVSQDIFQRKLDEVYKDIDNITNIADDIIISGSTREEHDEAFVKMLEASRANNVKLNPDKLQFRQQKVNFFGYSIGPEGISPATDKLKSIQNINAPTNVKELQSLLGIITYLNRFSSRLAELTSPLRELTKKNVHFAWEKSHQRALDAIKKELCSAQVLSFYDPNPETTTILQCDASTKGIGAWLRQIDDAGEERIIAMASRSLTGAETRYSNIERECLAVTFGLEKFEHYLLGRRTRIETDHSPLEQIFKKNINDVPSRLQRLVLRCLKFDVDVTYKQGKSIPVADALSRVCHDHNNSPQNNEVDFITVKSQLVSLEEVRKAASLDPTLCLLKSTIYTGWPAYRKQCPEELWEYWNYRCDLVLENGLILKGDKLLIPESLRQRVLSTVHAGHLGETKCLLLARQSVYWPGMTADIRQLVKSCATCNRHQPDKPKLPLLQPDMPSRPWEKIGADLFHFQGQVYLMIVDYYSRFPVIRNLTDMKAETVSNHFTGILSEYGIPSTIQTDFGSQFTTERFKKSCKDCGIELIFSSPYHHQTNGLAEKLVGVCKKLWTKALESEECPYTALWIYRSTPIDDSLPSPYEMLTGRKPNSLLPCSTSSLKPSHLRHEDHHQRNDFRQEKQAHFYNQKASKDQDVLPDLQPVYVRNTLKEVWEPGKILNRPQPEREPRTYAVKVNEKIYTRTRQHLRMRESNNQEQKTGESVMDKTNLDNNPATPNSCELENTTKQNPVPTAVTTRSGRVTKIPGRFRN